MICLQAIGQGIRVVTVTASDQDVGENGDIVFTIVEGNCLTLLFYKLSVFQYR